MIKLDTKKLLGFRLGIDSPSLTAKAGPKIGVKTSSLRMPTTTNYAMVESDNSTEETPQEETADVASAENSGSGEKTTETSIAG